MTQIPEDSLRDSPSLASVRGLLLQRIARRVFRRSHSSSHISLILFRCSTLQCLDIRCLSSATSSRRLSAFVDERHAMSVRVGRGRSVVHH